MENFNFLFSGFLLFSILLTCVSILLLIINKKYRRIPNLFLLASFILFLIHYIFYLLEYQGLFVVNHFRASSIMPFQLLPPLLIFLYAYTRLNGNITRIRELYQHLSVFILSVVFFIPIITDSFALTDNSAFFKFYSHTYRIFFSFTTIVLYFYQAKKIILIFLVYYKIETKNVLEGLKRIPKNAQIVKFVVGLLFLNGVWFLFELFISILVGDIHKYFDLLISVTLLALTFVLSFIFIKNPKTEIVTKPKW